VCDILGITERGIALQRLSDDEKGMCLTQTLGGPQQCRIINNPELYNLIIQSRKPDAHAFKCWITHEVLLTIRKTGGIISRRTYTDCFLMAFSIFELRG
jgi:anti-repressor protein